MGADEGTAVPARLGIVFLGVFVEAAVAILPLLEGVFLRFFLEGAVLEKAVAVLPLLELVFLRVFLEGAVLEKAVAVLPLLGVVFLRVFLEAAVAVLPLRLPVLLLLPCGVLLAMVSDRIADSVPLKVVGSAVSTDVNSSGTRTSPRESTPSLWTAPATWCRTQ